MRLYLSGLFTGLLVMFVAWSCAGPIGGNDGGGNDGKNGDVGVSVGALSVKEITVDCSKAVSLWSNGQGVELPGVDFSQIVSASAKKDFENNLVTLGGGGIYKKTDSKVFAICLPGQTTYELIIIMR